MHDYITAKKMLVLIKKTNIFGYHQPKNVTNARISRNNREVWYSISKIK